MPDSDEIKVTRIASDIARYLEDRPNAADTLDGITKWWLLRQRIEESDALVREALDHLISESVVVRKRNLDGDYVYSSAKPPPHDEK